MWVVSQNTERFLFSSFPVFSLSVALFSSCWWLSLFVLSLSVREGEPVEMSTVCLCPSGNWVSTTAPLFRVEFFTNPPVWARIHDSWGNFSSIMASVRVFYSYPWLWNRKLWYLCLYPGRRIAGGYLVLYFCFIFDIAGSRDYSQCLVLDFLQVMLVCLDCYHPWTSSRCDFLKSPFHIVYQPAFS